MPCSGVTIRRRARSTSEPLALEAGRVRVEAEVDHRLDTAAGPLGGDLAAETEPGGRPRRTPLRPALRTVRDDRGRARPRSSAGAGQGAPRGALAPTARAGSASRRGPDWRAPPDPIPMGVRIECGTPSARGRRRQLNGTTRTSNASSPLRPSRTLKSTRAPLSSVLKPSLTITEKWTNRSLPPPSGVMNP